MLMPQPRRHHVCDASRHSRFELCEIAFGFDPHAQRIAVVNTHRAFGLPGGELSER
jgi:hypothetical protein